jgi:hypothetical protein
MRKIAGIILLVACVTVSQAQDFRFGLTASPVISWFSVNGTDVKSEGPKLGFQYGLIFEPTIGEVERYAVSTGLIINMAGGFLSGDSTFFDNIDSVEQTITFNSSYRVQYIEIPVAIKLRTNEINYMSYYGSFGLTPGINIKARYDKEDSNGNNLVEDVDIRSKGEAEKYKLLNLSLTLGLGAEYGITETTTLTGGIVFQNGFMNVLESSMTEETIQMKQFVLRIGVLF